MNDIKKDHSIGEGTGAVAGAVTGAVVGSVAGPIGTVVGAIAGGGASASSNQIYVESGAGIGEGARTGLASVVTGVLLLVAMFATPLIGQHVSILGFLRGDTIAFSSLLLCFATTAIAALLLVWATTRLYEGERVAITG